MTAPIVDSPTLRFQDLVPGRDLGRVSIDPADLLADWSVIDPDLPAGDTLPPGLVVAVVMRAYLALTTGRPPGNIHAGLDLIFGEPALADRPIEVAVTVADAFVRKGRNRVAFSADCRQDGRAVLTATSTILWAT